MSLWLCLDSFITTLSWVPWVFTSSSNLTIDSIASGYLIRALILGFLHLLPRHISLHSYFHRCILLVSILFVVSVIVVGTPATFGHFVLFMCSWHLLIACRQFNAYHTYYDSGVIGYRRPESDHIGTLSAIWFVYIFIALLKWFGVDNPSLFLQFVLVVGFIGLFICTYVPAVPLSHDLSLQSHPFPYQFRVIRAIASRYSYELYILSLYWFYTSIWVFFGTGIGAIVAYLWVLYASSSIDQRLVICGCASGVVVSTWILFIMSDIPPLMTSVLIGVNSASLGLLSFSHTCMKESTHYHEVTSIYIYSQATIHILIAVCLLCIRYYWFILPSIICLCTSIQVLSSWYTERNESLIEV